MKDNKSIEPNIADLANGWLKSYKLDYKLEQESLNNEIDNALKEYFSKNGGKGANRPDAKLLLKTKDLKYYPILIEYKGYKNKLEKLDKDGIVENKKSKNEPNFININSYAVNGAVHYANALLHHTSYTDIIAIGMTGYREENGNIKHEIGVYYVAKNNLGAGQKVGEFTDLSFLSEQNFDEFIEKVNSLSLTQEELEKLKEQREKEIDISLTKLNNDIYQNEKGLGENDRVYLVASSIIASLGVEGKVKPLEKGDLKSSNEDGAKDGDIIVQKIKAFLGEKNIPQDKKELILRTLQNTLLSDNINKIENGETQLKRVFCKIVDDLGIYYKIGLTTDFTGKLFNEMYGWLGFTQDKLNDVVLTPSYIASLLVKLARVNKDSYVWDFATGSAGLLVAAMNEMLNDAKNSIKSPNELREKEVVIKSKQLLGIELLPSVYMLAILNMILMGDGSSNILNKNSLTDFEGNYGFGDTNKKFPADAFILNPPYSAPGNGMNFVEKALSMMNKGYASIIIQNSAGSGKATDINKRILERNTLLASIKMPIDIFIGKSSVQTHIYVFKVGEKNHKDDLVKFIDFSNDGYARTNRKKASNNLKDLGDAKERYNELVNLVRFGASKLSIYNKKQYFEGNIDPNSGEDWNQLFPVELKPSLNDFIIKGSEHISWKINNLLDKTENLNNSYDDKLKKMLEEVEWKEYIIGDLFDKIKVKSLKYKATDLPKIPKDEFVLPALTAGIQNQGLNNYVPRDNATIIKNVISISANGANTGATFYQPDEFTVLQDSYAIEWKVQNEKLTPKMYLFLATAISKSIYGNYEWTNKAGWEKVQYQKIKLPVRNQNIDFEFMQNIMDLIEEKNITNIKSYLK